MLQRTRNALRRVLHANCTNLTHAEAARIFQEAYHMRLERNMAQRALEYTRCELDRTRKELRCVQRQDKQHAQDEAARIQAEQERAQQPTHTATSLAMFVVWALVIAAVVALGVAIWLIVGG